jgi:anaerobic selenocysteine-containing dehydrogenase
MTIKEKERTVRAACPHDCPDTCALRVTVSGNRVIRVEGDPDHPATDGVLCTKVARYAERTHHPDRLTQPLRRIGPKGSGQFEPVSWAVAFAEIAARLTQIAARDPQRIVPYSYAGTMGFVQGDGLAQRFFYALGASRLDATICSAAGSNGLASVHGKSVGMAVEQFENSKLILLWGTNPVTSSVHLWRRIQAAKRKGAVVVAIDPFESDSAQKCDRWLALRPGTDAALALAMINVLITDDLLDHDWIEQYTEGFEALAERLARQWGSVRPAAIRVNYGVQRARGGADAVRAIAALAALTGAWRDAAGGMLLSSSGWFPVDVQGWQRPDLMPGWPDRLPRAVNMSAIGEALAIPLENTFGSTSVGSTSDGSTSDGSAAIPIEAIVVWNANPVAVAPDSESVIRGFGREDLFTVVLEHFQTDTADWADWVLPATTQMEHFDLHKSYGHTSLVVNHPAIAPIGDALPNSEIFRRLARAMGLTEPALFEDDETVARSALDWSHPRLAGVTWEGLLERGWAPLTMDPTVNPLANGGFPTASGRVQLVDPALSAQGRDPVPDWQPPWESVEVDPDRSALYPLQLISPPARNFLNTTFVNVTSIRAREGEPECLLHPADATLRGLADGALVKIFNDRGAFAARLRVTERARRGVAVAPSIWWHRDAPGIQGGPGRNVNAVTSQRLTEGGAGATFYDCRVEVEALA